MKLSLWGRLFPRKAVCRASTRKRTSHFRPQLITLEDRVVPATISLVGGNLTYTGTNVANTLALSLADPTYTFTNPLDSFTGTAPTGVTYQDLDSDTKFETAIVDTSLVNQLNINLGTAANIVNLGAFDAGIDPISVSGGGNAGSTLNVTAGGQGITTTGNVSFTGFNSINVLNQITAGNVTFQADQMTISQPVDAGSGNIQLSTRTAARPIQLGAVSNGAHLGLTQAQLDNLKASRLTIGNTSNGGTVDVVANIVIDPAKVGTLVLQSNSTISSAANTLSVNNLAFNATGNVNLSGAWDSVAGISGGSVTLNNAKDLLVGTVAGIDGVQAATTVAITINNPAGNGSLTVAKNITSTGASAITLQTTDTGNTEDITVNAGVTIASSGGNINLNAGDNLTINAGATLQTSGAGKINLQTDFGDNDGGTAILRTTGATLSAPAGATFTGSDDDDQFFVSPSINTAISIDGKGGANSLEFNAGGQATAIGAGSLTATGRQPVSFASINVSPITLVNTPSVSMQGTAGNDDLVLFGTPTGVEVSLNNGIHFAIGGAAFNFDGLGGTNTVTFDNLNGIASPAGGTTFTNVTEYKVKGSNGDDNVVLSKQGAVTGFTLNGGAFTALNTLNHFTFQGGNGNDTLTVLYGNTLANDPVPAGGVDFSGDAGADRLAVISPVILAGRSGSYLPGAVNGDGRITVAARQIRFTSLAPVDVTGMTDFTVEFPNGNEVLAISPGTAFTVPGQSAIHVSGTTGGTGFEEIAIWNVTNLTVDTSTNVQGNDDITVNGTGTGHNVSNITLKTGDGSDTVTFNGTVNLSGNLSVEMGNDSDAVNATGSAHLTIGGSVTFDLGNDTDSSTFAAGSTVNTGADFNWLGGNGDDTIISRAAITVGGTFTLNSGDGVNSTDLAAGSANVTGAMNWLGGSGDDTNTSRAVITVGGAFTVNFGAGTNSTDFAAGSVNVTGAMNWLGGAGNDNFNSSVNMSVGSSFTINPGDGANTTTLAAGTTTAVTSNVAITGGTGVDIVNSNGSLTVGGSLTANLGGGNDQISVATTTVTGAIAIDGQGASDTVNINGVTSGSGVSLTAETINITADLTATTTTVDLLNVTRLNVAGVKVEGKTGITQTGDIDAVHLTGVAPVQTTFFSPSGFINFASNINGTTPNTQQLNIHANGVVTVQNIGNASVPANAVRLGDLNVTSDIGFLFLQGASYFAGAQVYNSPTLAVVLAANVTFDGNNKDITFNCALNALASDTSNVSVLTTGVTTFNGPVGSTLIGTFPLRSLFTNFGGSTKIQGGSVTTTRIQDYEDDVLVNHTSGLTTLTTTLNGSITFGQTLNAGSDVQSLTLSTGLGDILFNGNVGNAVARLRDIKITSAGNVVMGATTANTFKAAGFNQQSGSGVTTINANTTLTQSPVSAFAIIADITNNAIVLNNSFTSAQDTRFNPNVAGVTQNTGTLTTNRLIFAGTGTFNVDQLSNLINTDFQANVNGDILLAAQKLVISQSGVITSNDDVTLRSATDFTAKPNTLGGQLISMGTGDFQLFHGLQSLHSKVEFTTEIVAGSVNLGAPPLSVTNKNDEQDSYIIRPSANVVINVWGNDPSNNLVQSRNDVLTNDFSDLPANTPVTLVSSEITPGSGSFKGTFSFGGVRKDLNFHSIEEIGDFKLVATVFQTVEGNAQIVLGATVSDFSTGTSLPSVNLPANTFIVNPRLVNPNAPFGAPRIALGDINGDGSDDLVLAGGSNQSPIVIAIDGKKLVNIGLAGSSATVQTLPQDFILAKFLAYDPKFMGGVFVAVGKLVPSAPSKQAQIIVGPGAGIGPRVRAFDYQPVAHPEAPMQPFRYTGSPTPIPPLDFNAYDKTFKGGVRVALRYSDNPNDEPEIVTAPGAGIPGEIRFFVHPIGTTPAPLPNRSFRPYEDVSPNFKGGLYIATGDYDEVNNADDLLVGPGAGLEARVRVYQDGGKNSKIVDFVAFGNERPSSVVTQNASQKIGVGGVSFAKDSVGRPGIMVGSAPGRQSELRFFSKTVPGINPPPPADDGIASNPDVFTIIPSQELAGGTWRLQIDGVYTKELDYNITAAALLQAIKDMRPDTDLKHASNHVLSVDPIPVGADPLQQGLRFGFVIKFEPDFIHNPSHPFVPFIAFDSKKLVGSTVTIKPTKLSATGSWILTVDGISTGALPKNISDKALKDLLNSNTMLGSGSVNDVARTINGDLIIAFSSDYAENHPVIVKVSGSMAGKITKNAPLAAGAYSSSTQLLRDYLGNYFRYDALLISELVQNRFRDGAHTVVSSNIKT